MSKGSNRRPGDNEAFDKGYDAIFSGKPVRGSWVFDTERGEMVLKSEYQSKLHNAPMIMADIAPYRSMIDGQMITSRSQHRMHLKQHGMIEIGNEVSHAMKPQRRDDRAERESRKRVIADVLASKGY